MSKLGILDIVALAKAGYKAAEVKEMLSAEIPDPVPADGGTDNKEDKKDPEPDNQPPAENPAKESGQGKEGDPGKDDNVDYKKLYEDKCKELETAQQKNVHQNQPEKPKTPTIDDIVRSFM